MTINQKPSVLFLCSGNSARSQIAEVLLKHQAGDYFDVYSAGTQPEAVDQKTISLLSKFGINDGDLRSKHIDEFKTKAFDYVISLCDEARAECSGYPASGKRMEWNFEDPKTRACNLPFETTFSEINNRISMFVIVEIKKPHPTQVLDPIVFYKNFTDEVRLKCLMLIQYEGELCVCELMSALEGISQPKVSRHLALLRKSGVLLDRKQGQWVFYRINPTLPLWAKSVLAMTTENNIHFVGKNISRLYQTQNRPVKSN